MKQHEGIESHSLADVERTLADTLAEHIGVTCTGAALRLESAHQPAIEIVAGTLDRTTFEPVQQDSRFDLASLSKLFTASAILRLVAGDRLALDEPVVSILPGYTGAGKAAVTLRHLLTHSAGLPPLIRLFGPTRAAGDPWESILTLPLVTQPGKDVAYSDVGFMLLGRIAEEVTGQSLREAVRTLVLEPLNLDDAGYGPVTGAVATEFDPWRGRRIQGEVHDENAAVLGGASGHAGVFGTTRAVCTLARAYLDTASGFLPPALALAARSEQMAWGEERRGLGWDLRSPDAAASEAAFSADTFGHYGFTGTAVWADPQRAIIIVLLANRVYFGRDAAGIQALRRQVFRAVAEAFPIPAT